MNPPSVSRILAWGLLTGCGLAAASYFRIPSLILATVLLAKMSLRVPVDPLENSLAGMLMWIGILGMGGTVILTNHIPVEKVLFNPFFLLFFWVTWIGDMLRRYMMSH